MHIDQHIVNAVSQQNARPVLDPREVNDHAVNIDHANKHTRTINDFVAAEEPEAHQEISRGDVEPHGMFWHRGSPNAPLTLKAHAWFYTQVETAAYDVLTIARERFGKDESLSDAITKMSEFLREYVSSRAALNDMAGARKLKQEADDAAYQLCQAAKYSLDATERAQYHIARGNDIDDNAQIERLMSLSESSMREGYAVAMAVIAASDAPVKIDFKLGAKRVVDYSCKRLTEWFAKKRVNQEQEQALKTAGAKLQIESFLRGLGKPKAA